MAAIIRRDRRPIELFWPEERIDRLFRDIFARGVVFDRFFDGWPTTMHIEEYIEDDTGVIRAELPGLDPEKDIKVEVTDGLLHLQARREERTAEQRPLGYHSEFRYGSFERSIPLPDGATEDDVKASYTDGILEVRIPVRPTEKPATPVPITHT